MKKKKEKKENLIAQKIVLEVKVLPEKKMKKKSREKLKNLGKD